MALQGIEVEGVIIKEYPAKEGVSQRTGNAWKSQEFVIQTKDQYPRACLFRVFGADKLEQFNIHQGDTVHVWLDINAYQEFIDYFPESSYKERAQKRMYELQDKLILKEYLSAKLYYNLGDYFGNCLYGGSNYEACIVTSENTLKTYPFTSMREDFAILILKSKFELAQRSVEEKRIDRYREAEDECYAFINEFPESNERPTAEKYLEKCKKVTGD